MGCITPTVTDNRKTMRIEDDGISWNFMNGKTVDLITNGYLYNHWLQLFLFMCVSVRLYNENDDI